ncbi:hypothetical protein ACH5RR_014710 [Cinchona calisaya]|uniref:Cystatin domain-containing protein n=1 Tax=Cinchona calisaya TaxID=153742 RepID=A0ABD2ZSR6_9GENT
MAYKYEASHVQAQQPTFINLFVSTQPTAVMEGLPSAGVAPVLNLAEDTVWKQLADLVAQKALSPGQQVKVGDSYFIILDPKDPAVIQVGKSAVDEQNKKAGTKLKFVEVAAGLKLNLSVPDICGLLIKAKDGQETDVYAAVWGKVPLVWKKLLVWVKVPFVALPCN